MAPKKSKANPVPQDRAQASKALAEFAAIEREIDQLEIEMNGLIAEVKKDYFDRALPLRQKADALEEGLQTYCEANRDDLTKGRKSKTVSFGVGKVEWRIQPKKVVINGKEESLVDYIRHSEDDDLKKFIRTTFELNRVEVLRHPDELAKLPGVEIADSYETFQIKPDSAKIPDDLPAEAAQ